MRLLESLLATILNTLFPPVCISCKKEGDFLCDVCIRGLNKRKIRPNYYRSKNNKPEFEHLDGVIYALDYAKNPMIQAAIKQLKYKFTEELANQFADLMVEKMGELSMIRNRKIILIPVPLHKKRLNYRGFNQAKVIASAIQSRLPEVEQVDVLERTRHTSQQAKLNKVARHKNLKDAFRVNHHILNNTISLEKLNTKITHEQKNCSNDKPTAQAPIIFIVDDVSTTGATLEQCAKTLKEVGLSKVYGLVIARAFR